jgi:hypothetical protein
MMKRIEPMGFIPIDERERVKVQKGVAACDLAASAKPQAATQVARPLLVMNRAPPPASGVGGEANRVH